jgi:hypothetical protein
MRTLKESLEQVEGNATPRENEAIDALGEAGPTTVSDLLSRIPSMSHNAGQVGEGLRHPDTEHHT